MKLHTVFLLCVIEVLGIGSGRENTLLSRNKVSYKKVDLNFELIFKAILGLLGGNSFAAFDSTVSFILPDDFNFETRRLINLSFQEAPRLYKRAMVNQICSMMSDQVCCPL